MIINKDANINLKSISITLLVIYMLTASLYIAILNSYSIQIAILITITCILIINELLLKKKYMIKRVDVLFVFSILVIPATLYSSTLRTGDIADAIALCLLIIISFMIRGNIENYDLSLIIIKWGAVFIAFSVIFHYLFPPLYNNTFLSLLRPEISKGILIGVSNGLYTGFSGQVGFTAGYIINGIGIICCAWIIKSKGFKKRDILLLIILLLGLLLTQKRAHLLFGIISIFFVYIQYSNFKFEKLKKSFQLLVFSTFIIMIAALFTLFTDVGKTLFFRIIDSVQNLSAGEDITSNRMPLWDLAWSQFLQNPIFGIGWGNFRGTVIGNVTVQTEMETHNIYLQLLSETGIVGFVFILTPFIITYVYTLKLTQIVSLHRNKFLYKWRFAVIYSLFTQTFFLLYGFTGNPLYDFSFLVMYILSFGLIYSFSNFYRENQVEFGSN